eukprot:4538604-Pyramimonas_sp.AAC.1
MQEQSGVSRAGREHRALSAGRPHRSLHCVYRGHHEGARVRPLSWPVFVHVRSLRAFDRPGRWASARGFVGRLA